MADRETNMGKVIQLHEARASVGHRSGRSSSRGTPVSRSIDSTNSAGTPRLDFSSQYQTIDCVVPMRSANGFWPPATPQARLSASVDMPPQYQDFSITQPKSLCGTDYRILGRFPVMRKVDKIAFGSRVARRRVALKLNQTEVAKAVGMKQQGVDAIENGRVARPRLLKELAVALRTTQEWLLWHEGDEDAPELDPDEILALLRRLKPARRKLAIRMLRAMEEEEAA